MRKTMETSPVLNTKPSKLVRRRISLPKVYRVFFQLSFLSLNSFVRRRRRIWPQPRVRWKKYTTVSSWPTKSVWTLCMVSRVQVRVFFRVYLSLLQRRVGVAVWLKRQRTMSRITFQVPRWGTAIPIQSWLNLMWVTAKGRRLLSIAGNLANAPPMSVAHFSKNLTTLS